VSTIHQLDYEGVGDVVVDFSVALIWFSHCNILLYLLFYSGSEPLAMSQHTKF